MTDLYDASPIMVTQITPEAMSELTDDRLRQIVVALQGQVLPRRLDPTLVHAMATELLALREVRDRLAEIVKTNSVFDPWNGEPFKG